MDIPGGCMADMVLKTEIRYIADDQFGSTEEHLERVVNFAWCPFAQKNRRLAIALVLAEQPVGHADRSEETVLYQQSE